jgi:mannose-6-phosphate isomerase-like protein (cupin superfamily)
MKGATTVMMLLAAGYLWGLASPAPTSAQTPGAAQAPGQRQGQPPAAAPACGRGRGNAPEGRCTDEARAASNMFLLRAPADARAQPGKARLFTREDQNALGSFTHFDWAPEYRLTATTRPAAVAGKEPTDGELHTDNTQVYLITNGTGTVLVEGAVAPDKEYLVAPGEYRGGPMTGGRQLKVKAGDLVSIPPLTWHTAYGDPGTPLKYVIIHIHTRTTIP